MKYYILNNQIKTSSVLPNPEFYIFQELTQSQIDFYLNNPSASIQEVLNKELYIPDPPTLEELKNQKTNEILNEFENQVQNGYYDSELDITIRIADSDRNQFNQRITLINLIPPEQRPGTTIITDINNVSHEFNLMDFYGLMIRMGIYYDQYLWSKKTSLIEQIQNVTESSELNEINW